MKTPTAKFKAIGKFLKRARENAKLSQGDVKKLLGYKSPQIISDWERGICGVPLASLHTLKKAYGLNEHTILKIFMNAERKELEKCLRRGNGKIDTSTNNYR